MGKSTHQIGKLIDVKNLKLFPGVLPHVPRVLPAIIQDDEMRERVAETFMSEDFKNNIEEYFVQNIKVC